jgi:peptidoglycan hydrolase CwlO-like protein
MKRAFLILLLLTLSGFVPAATDEAAKASKEKQSYLQKTDREMQDWTSKIKSLEERSQTSGTKTREELDRHIKTVKDDLEAARKKIEELRRSSENAWGSLRKGLDRTLDDVKRHYQKAVSATPAVPPPAKK